MSAFQLLLRRFQLFSVSACQHLLRRFQLFSMSAFQLLLKSDPALYAWNDPPVPTGGNLSRIYRNVEAMMSSRRPEDSNARRNTSFKFATAYSCAIVLRRSRMAARSSALSITASFSASRALSRNDTASSPAILIMD